MVDDTVFKSLQDAGTSSALASESSKPDWNAYTLEQKVNLVLDMQFKVVNDLNKHSGTIEKMMDRLNQNSNDIKRLSNNLEVVNDSLTKVTLAQESSANDIDKVMKQCSAHAASITAIESRLISLAGIPSTSNSSSNASSSMLLVSGIPNQVMSNTTPQDIVHQVFSKLNISNLESDVLSVRELKGKNISTPNKSQTTRHSLVLNLKSSQVREHILSVKRQYRKLLAKDVFTINEIMTGELIYLNEFLSSETYKLLKSTKTKAKELKYKYAWASQGAVYLKSNDESPKIQIHSVDDLNNLE